MSAEGVSRDLAEFVAATDGTWITGRDRAAAERACLDTVGVILAGADSPAGRLIAAEVAERGGAPEATLLATGERFPAPLAAFGNGAAAHTCHDDDWCVYGHPSAPLLGALLASAELEPGLSGLDFVTAYCVGFQVAAALWASSRYDEAERGFDATAVFGTIAATAASCRALGLDASGTAMALAIAASQTGGLIANTGTMTAALHAGVAAENGVRSALLARDGLTGAVDIFEARQGYAEAYFGFGRFDLSQLRGALTVPMLAASLRISAYPCDCSSHVAITALLDTLAEHALASDDVMAVEVSGVPHTAAALRFPEPRTVEQSRTSLHHALAVALVHRAVEHAGFTEEALEDARLADARGRIRVTPLSRWDPAFMYQWPERCQVTLRLRDGRTISGVADAAGVPGGPERPVSAGALAERVRGNAARLLAEEEAAAVAAAWGRLGAVASVAALIGDLAERVRALETVAAHGGGWE